MKIVLTSVMVDDREKALRLVESPEGAAGVELFLEPAHPPPSKVYQKALFGAGIPLTRFGVDDAQAEVERLKALGVVFRMEPTKTGPVIQTVQQ
jgi:hypothetical protein